MIGDPILHIELRRWADVVLVAPCSANTLAKMAGGICDNLAVRFRHCRAQQLLIFIPEDISSPRVNADDADLRLPGNEHSYVRASTYCGTYPCCEERASLRSCRPDWQDPCLWGRRAGSYDRVEGYCRHCGTAIYFKTEVLAIISMYSPVSILFKY